MCALRHARLVQQGQIDRGGVIGESMRECLAIKVIMLSRGPRLTLVMEQHNTSRSSEPSLHDQWVGTDIERWLPAAKRTALMSITLRREDPSKKKGCAEIVNALPKLTRLRIASTTVFYGGVTCSYMVRDGHRNSAQPALLITVRSHFVDLTDV